MLGNLQIRSRLPLILILAARFALGLTYSLINPPWESYDEDGHFAYARYLAKYRTLLQPGDPEAEQVWEKFQPPLYYLLIAPTIAGFDLGQRFELPERNPYFIAGNAGVNYSLHPDSLPGEKLSIERALLVARALSVVLSTLSVLFVYRTAGCLWPAQAHPVWAVTLLYAFWPQFLFVGSMLTNDVLATTFAALLCYLMIELASKRFRLGLAVALGVTLAAALLTKINTIAFIVPIVVALFISISQAPIRWRSPRAWLPLLGLGLLIASILWLLNSFKFVTAHIFRPASFTEFLNSVSGLNPKGPLKGQFLLSVLGYGFRTFVASLGWGNLETYPWLYRLWAVGAALSLLVIIRSTFRRRSHPDQPMKLFALLGLQVFSLVALTFSLAITYRDIYLFPGRYLLPALPALSFLLIGGWHVFIPQKLKAYFWKTISLGIVLVGWSIPFKTLAPAYAKPQPLKDMAKIDYPLHLFFNQEIELLGAIRPAAVQPDHNLEVSFCWQALTSLTKNYSIFLEVVGPDGEGYGHLETYPGRGNYPTSFWKVNQPFCDDYTLQVRGDVPSPSAAHLRIALLAGVQGNPLGVTDSSGEAIPPDGVVLPLKIQADGRDLPPPSHPVNYYFGEGINLIGYDLETVSGDDSRVRVTLHWKALQDVQDNYVVFVHLRDVPDHAYAQDDSQPRRAWYPTSGWQSGEIILDEHDLYFPEQPTSSALSLYAGLYNSETGVRLPAFDEQGRPIPNGEVILAEGLIFK